MNVQKPESAVSQKVRGVVAAIATPLAGLAPDHDRFVSLARKLLEGGCDALNVLGTTGEATSFTSAQRTALMSTAAKSLPLNRMMVGTGAAAIGDAVALSQHASSLGFAGILVLPPFYYKGIADAGVIAYIGAIVEATRDKHTPVYLYNFPALSGVQYTPAIVSALVQRFGARIAGLKDSSGDLAYAREIAAISRALDVFPSNEGTLMDARNGGPFAGCISASANVNAKECGKAYRDGDTNALAKAVAVRKLFDGLPLIAGIKTLLAHIHGDPALENLMPPLTPVADPAALRARYDALK
ncbi:MAG: dihydrodipicolinate synthase family protein [Rhodospirillaceae bacterium]